MAKIHTTNEYLNHVYDVLHFVARTREIRVVTATWYRQKFRPEQTRDAGSRAWERFKHRIRELEIPFVLEDMESDESTAKTKGVRFVLPEAWNRIESLLETYCPEDRSVGDDESGTDSGDRRADRGDQPVLDEGRSERDGHVPVRGVDARSREGLSPVLRHTGS